MPLSTGQEQKGVEYHELDRWYETSTGVVFRLLGEPKRLFEGQGKEGKPDPVRHAGDVELVNGRETVLVWRFEDTELLAPWYNWLPRWLVAWLKPLPPLPRLAAPSPAAGVPSAGVPSGAPEKRT
jgi:hypothetical protein